MAKTRGGAKKPFRNKKEYQRHLREMVQQGKGTEASGDWTNAVSNPSMRSFLTNGYKIR